MKRAVMAGVLLLGQAVAFADIGYDQAGRVVWTKGLNGAVPMTLEDVAFLGATAIGLAMVAPIQGNAGPATAATAFIAWGAWRTNKYRPEATKQAIRASLLAKAKKPKPGSVEEMLGH